MKMRNCAIALVLLAACGSNNNAPQATPRATVTGSVAGTPFGANDAATIVVRRTGSPTIDVLVTNLSDSCAGNGANVKSKQVLSLGLTAPAATGLDAGSYSVYDSQSGTIPQGNFAVVDFHSTSTACADTTPPNTLGASGRITISRMALDGADAGVAGDFDLFLQNGDRLKGTFDSPLCPSVDAGTAADAGCH